jgi:hypothetical protein
MAVGMMDGVAEASALADGEGVAGGAETVADALGVLVALALMLGDGFLGLERVF